MRVNSPRARSSPRAFDQLAPQRRPSPGVDQQHALVVEPDAAVAGREVQPRRQVGDVGEACAVDLEPLGMDQRQAAGTLAVAHGCARAAISAHGKVLAGVQRPAVVTANLAGRAPSILRSVYRVKGSGVFSTPRASGARAAWPTRSEGTPRTAAAMSRTNRSNDPLRAVVDSPFAPLPSVSDRLALVDPALRSVPGTPDREGTALSANRGDDALARRMRSSASGAEATK